MVTPFHVQPTTTTNPKQQIEGIDALTNIHCLKLSMSPTSQSNTLLAIISFTTQNGTLNISLPNKKNILS